MFNYGANEWGRMLLMGIGALLLSTPVVGTAVAPAQSEPCLVVPTQADGEQLVCSHA
jgi:hypothetical protein